MTLSVMVKEPGNQDGSDIGGWRCFLAVLITPLTNSINVDWLGIKVTQFVFVLTMIWQLIVIDLCLMIDSN